MSILKSKRPLLKCYRAHEIRGRIRITSRALRYIGRGEECEHLLSHFKTLDGVRNVRINIPASSVVVNFDAAKTTSDNILAAVEEILAAHSLGILQREREERNRLLVQERDLHEEALSTLITRSAVSGTLLLGTWLAKKAVPATMFGRLTCFPGLGNVYEAQDAMRNQIRGATTVISMATMLHTIATGNMTPSYRVLPDGTVRQIYFYCVDVSEFVVNKLADRGSLSARGIVTNVQDFVVNLQKGLGL